MRKLSSCHNTQTNVWVREAWQPSAAGPMEMKLKGLQICDYSVKGLELATFRSQAWRLSCLLS